MIFRRTFIPRSDLPLAAARPGSGAAGARSPKEPEAAAKPDVIAAQGPDAIAMTLTVNGIARIFEAEPRVTLAEALRGPLALTGTKIACNRGACSSCTVWLDGTPIVSCMILAVDVGNRAVTTIEGLIRDGKLHPVQAAFIGHDAIQCGFCTPGMVMSCAALLDRDPEPTRDAVLAAISGHLCRCGTYPHVVAATLAANEEVRS